MPATPVTPAIPTPAASKTATLDVLLAPSVLKHRYVRGVDHSSIVERPERIRAVLLGVAGALGAEHHDHAAKSGLDDTADLAEKLGALAVAEQHVPLRVLHTTRALSIDDPCAALRRIHALASDPAPYSTLSDYSLAHPKGGGPDTASHTAALSYLARNSPAAPPGTKRPTQKPQNVSDASSSDGEGDERMHACEIPNDLSQGDLYLCGPHTDGLADTSDGGSREAICHALGACAEAVDRVVAGAQGLPHPGVEISPFRATQHNALAADVHPATRTANDVPARRAFVLARPPGHHCSGSMPSGFCWVNNVAVAAAHAHSVHGIDRVIVLDIDLHHGNGTQALAWRINSEAAGVDADRASRLAAARREARGRRKLTFEQLVADEQIAGPRALRMFYGSVHDIESYPCEDGDVDMIRNASVCLAVHLETHKDTAEFDALYASKYVQLLDKARRFARETGAFPQRTLVIISCGFDACTYEYPGMQRHGKHVPPAFYAHFAADAARLADEVADGKLISVLEGGYSDRALTSAAAAHVGALADMPWIKSVPMTLTPWAPEQLTQLQRMAKHVRARTGGAAASRRRAAAHPVWCVRASEHFAAYLQTCGVDARPLELISQTSTPRARSRAFPDPSTFETPTHTNRGGHALRDRTLIKSRSYSALNERSKSRAPETPRAPKTPARGAALADEDIFRVPGALPQTPQLLKKEEPKTPTSEAQPQDDGAPDALAGVLAALRLGSST
ncbi:histone deacetylase [Malassezia cuniculi]|uniref:Histone deacetylase n=1 Tax=Malassezia cuniculi TaxID=948313 RepID=A0AAF0ESU8_9BASI|nr:histone deacetylase [Malassezia cuniculi]